MHTAMVFLQIPFEYGGFGAVGKKYEAMKDFCRWNGLDEKETIPIFTRMASAWINNIPKES